MPCAITASAPWSSSQRASATGCRRTEDHAARRLDAIDKRFLRQPEMKANYVRLQVNRRVAHVRAEGHENVGRGCRKVHPSSA